MMQPNQFETAATTYNNFATIQAFSANAIMDIMPNTHPENILDIGCGTGLLTQRLRHAYPNTHITAIDASSAMLNELKKQDLPNVTPIQLDYMHQCPEQSFDMIVSNAAIQWMNAHVCLTNISNQLSNNGQTYLAIYGRNTCVELETVLQPINKHHSLPARQFLTQPELTTIGKKYFGTWTVTTITKTIYFESVIHLLTTQKQTGVHAKKPNGLWTPRTIQALESAFYATYNRIQLSYEIHLCQAKK